MSFDNSNIRPTLIDSSNGRRRKLDNCSSESDFSWFYNYFGNDYGIAFFINERRKHYRNLNNEIFKPLSQLNLNKKISYSNSLFDYVKYSIHNVKTSLFYRDSLKHLVEDRPNFNLDSKLDNLKETLENHNKEVESLEKEIPQIIKNKFRISFPTITVRQYPYTKSNIEPLLKNRFEQFYNNSTSDKIIDNINTYSTKETYKEVNFENGIIRIGGIRIAEDESLKETDVEQYIKILDELIKDDFIANKLKNIKESNENLDLQINEIKQEITPIIESIERTV